MGIYTILYQLVFCILAAVFGPLFVIPITKMVTGFYPRYLSAFNAIFIGNLLTALLGTFIFSLSGETAVPISGLMIINVFLLSFPLQAFLFSKLLRSPDNTAIGLGPALMICIVQYVIFFMCLLGFSGLLGILFAMSNHRVS